MHRPPETSLMKVLQDYTKGGGEAFPQISQVSSSFSPRYRTERWKDWCFKECVNPTYSWDHKQLSVRKRMVYGYKSWSRDCHALLPCPPSYNNSRLLPCLPLLASSHAFVFVIFRNPVYLFCSILLFATSLQDPSRRSIYGRNFYFQVTLSKRG